MSLNVGDYVLGIAQQDRISGKLQRMLCRVETDKIGGEFPQRSRLA
jgi:hypothetical protein